MLDRLPRDKTGNRSISRLFLAVVLACLLIALDACPNPSSSPSTSPSSETLLAVTGTIPADGASDVPPGQAIEVSFNRDLDLSYLEEHASDIEVASDPHSSCTLSYAYENETHTLRIDAHPYLACNATYTVSLTRDLGLSRQVSWSFSTGYGPAGDVQIDEEHPPYRHNGKLYTHEGSVDLSLQYNESASSLQLSNNLDFSNATDIALSSGPASTSYHWPLSDGPGAKTIYARFKDSGDGMSGARSAAIIVDTVVPSIPPIPLTYYNALTTSLHLPVSPVDDIGIASCEWSADPGVNIDSPDSLSPAITISGPDKDYTGWLTVTDYAGNTSDRQYFTITKDTDAPGRPTDVGSQTLSLYTRGNFWAWLHSNNPDLANDSFLIQLDDETPIHRSISTQDLGTLTLEDNKIHTLVVWQVDAAGNPSPPLSMQVTVTPIVPVEGSALSWLGVGFQWRDFTGTPATTKYRITYGHYNGTDLDELTIKTKEFLLGRLESDAFYNLDLSASYGWYLEWSLNGGSAWPYRSPAAGTYYHFSTTNYPPQ